jgi:site-specific DNA-methyltransferase (adenine-specific)/adenine-specific DNA-methyltransferase
MKDLNKQDIEFLIECLKTGKEIPEVYKYAIFPTKQKEYELVYAGKMRKEDVLADTEEAKPVPLQIEKIFNGNKYPLFSKNWHNLLVFGDNLQILKTFYEDKAPIIKGKIKGQVKLIYIDPPFGTGDDYDAGNGQSAYSAKRKGADFVEFLRRRLFLLREILSDEGAIFVRMDYHFGHYVKLLLDEVFGKENFLNEITIKRGYVTKSKSNRFLTGTDSLFFYSKIGNHTFNGFEIKRTSEERQWRSLEMPGERKSYEKQVRYFEGKPILPPKGQHWGLSQEMVDKLYEKGEIRLNRRVYTDLRGKKQNGMIEFLTGEYRKVDSNWTDIQSYSIPARTGYPTENSEALLERVIKSASNKGDLVLDVFAGSGTTLAVAEKLGRRWIGCDIGKLSIYTIQKRLLGIDQSKDLESPKKKYGKPSKSFAVVTSGLYDLGKIFDLQKDEYVNFVKDLFEIEEAKQKTVGGIEIDGKKRDFLVKIFPYWEFKNTSVDEKYLRELHKNIGQKIDGRFYIIAPANNVDFVSDYYQIDNVRYYFLKVPYQIIKELHKVQFKKLRQPQSKNQINDLDEAIGFHFVRQPEVKSEMKVLKDKVVLKIKKFESAYSQDETGEKLKNFESLAMLLVDSNYDGEKFMMTNYYFAQDLLNHKSSNEEEENEEEIKEELKKQTEIIKEFPKKECGRQIMAVYVDIYGNEFREVFKVK